MSLPLFQLLRPWLLFRPHQELYFPQYHCHHSNRSWYLQDIQTGLRYRVSGRTVQPSLYLDLDLVERCFGSTAHLPYYSIPCSSTEIQNVPSPIDTIVVVPPQRPNAELLILSVSHVPSTEKMLMMPFLRTPCAHHRHHRRQTTRGTAFIAAAVSEDEMATLSHPASLL